MKRLLKWIAVAAVLLAVLLRLLFFTVSIGHVPPSADECANVLMAKHIAQGERPLLFWGQPYQFPLEAYLLSGLVRWMPRTAFGARYLHFVLSILSLAALLLALRQTAGPGTAWPAALLLLFPSAYWLTLQTAYFIPNYTSFLLLSSLVLWLTAVAHEGDPPDASPNPYLMALSPARENLGRRALVCALTGLLAGIGYSCHMLILPVVVLCGLSLCLGRNWRQAVTATPSFLLGLALGLAPYWAAGIEYKGANLALQGTRSLAAALRAAQNYAITHTVPGAMGVTPPLFPDFEPALQSFRWLAAPAGVAWLVALAAATFLRALAFCRRLARDFWPSVRMNDIFVGLSWLALALFVASRRGNSGMYRYLLPAALSFPFVASCLYAAAAGRVRRVIGGAAVAIAVLNVAASGLLIREWAKPGFAAGAPDIPDLDPVIDFLHQRGTSYCYGSLWLAYRITHDTDEAIVCSQPYNERFVRWGLPYRDLVDAARGERPFVLSATHQARLSSTDFESHLKAEGISAQRSDFGPVSVFHTFRQPASERDQLLPPRSLSASASHNPGYARNLVDGDPFSRWKSRANQDTNMWVQVRLASPAKVHGVVLVCTGYAIDHPRALRLFGHTGSRWHWLARGDVPADFDELVFVRGQPMYGESWKTVRFQPRRLDALRIYIGEPTAARNWTIGEIGVLTERRAGP